MTDTLTTADAAALLNVDASQVRRLCIRGKLTATRKGRDWMIDKDEVFDAYAERTTRTQGRGRPTYADLQAERDELRRQRDEALQALRDLLDTPTGELSTRRAVDILAQYEEGDA